MVKFVDVELEAMIKAVKKGVSFCMYLFPEEDVPVFFADSCSIASAAALRNDGRRFIIGEWNKGSKDFLFINDTMDAASCIEYCNSFPGQKAELQSCAIENPEINKEDYLHDIRSLTEELRTFRGYKVVISRAIIAAGINTDVLSSVVKNVFEAFPRSFRYIYYTPQTGIWLGASPEILLLYDDATGEAESMALAGTRPLENNAEAWSLKDIEEQRIVVDYICGILRKAGKVERIEGPDTMTTGNIQHLRTLLSVSLNEKNHASAYRLIDRLNPTPALCGYPKDWAMDKIKGHELHERNCYGGIVGVETTEYLRTYVNLRCINFNESTSCIYAGGGIIDKSSPEAEWEETERKASAIMTFLPGRKNEKVTR